MVLGINAAYHETAAALVHGGEVLVALEEERCSRVKHGKRARVDNPDELPWRAIEQCLNRCGVSLKGLDAVAYSLLPGQRRPMPESYALPPGGFGTPEGESEFDARLRRVAGVLAAREPALEGRVHFVPHHLCHAASAFYPSPFDRAAVLVVDGIGENATGWLGRGEGNRLEPREELLYPHSLGMLWERVAEYLGFSAYDAAKVMGLAAYGEAERAWEGMGRLLHVPDADGREPFRVDSSLAQLRSCDVQGLEALFGPRRRAEEPPEEPRLAAVAAALQKRTEQALLALCRRLARLTGLSALCYSGGVALNCVANACLERHGPFEAIYVPGAAHDAGTAVGAALELSFRLSGSRRGQFPIPLPPFLGPDWSEEDVARAIADASLPEQTVPDPARLAARLLEQGQVVGWFQGRTELGPRALGHRSLLADPRRPEMRQILNDRIKHREPFRPFAASVLAEQAAHWLDLPERQPGAAPSRELMVLAYPVRPERRPQIPAVVHRDGTCRIQAVDRERHPLFHSLLSHFDALTGVPLVLNTSFNDSEPIVHSPQDALRTFQRCGLDALIMGRHLVCRE